MSNHQRSMTKIEVLLDKINLLHSSLQTAGQPDRYDLQLMRRYAHQLAEVLDVEFNTPDEDDVIPPAAALPSASPVFDFDTPGPAPAAGSTEQNEPEPESEISPSASGEGEPTLDNPGFSFVQDEPGTADFESTNDPSPDSGSPFDTDNPDPEEEAKASFAHETDEASLNDIFKIEQKDLADQLKDQPIQSLKNEIDLNQKFWFIQELFEGDGPQFNQLLTDLDQLHHFGDARHKIESLGRQYHWEEKTKAAEKFMQLVRRRYV